MWNSLRKTNSIQKFKLALKNDVAKLSGRCKMESERTAMTDFKGKLSPIWYDIHVQGAVCTSLYIIAFDSDKTTKNQIPKRVRRNLKIELSRLNQK